MRITDYLTKNDIKINLIGRSKQDIIEEMVAFMVSKHPEIKGKEALAKVLERESLETTGIGEGVAIPHARLDCLDDLQIVCGSVPDGADFKSLDDKPVKIVFLILYPEDQISLQIRFLARVSRLLHVSGLKNRLFASKSSDELYEVLKNFEDTHFH
ncbi:MAG: PTS sugar transporter subunit IIA [bacterium]|nr:PTS sugar transporter subunit IIA [bacterium]MBU1917849.1 PTS sugar transporter subunit IIA [bacterium]